MFFDTIADETSFGTGIWYDVQIGAFFFTVSLTLGTIFDWGLDSLSLSSNWYFKSLRKKEWFVSSIINSNFWLFGFSSLKVSMKRSLYFLYNLSRKEPSALLEASPWHKTVKKGLKNLGLDSKSLLLSKRVSSTS